MDDEWTARRQREAAAWIGAAALIAAFGLLLPTEFSERYSAGWFLVAILVVAALSMLTTGFFWIAGPLCGVALGWFAFVPILNWAMPRFDQDAPSIAFVAGSFAIAGLILVALARMPWRAWRQKYPRRP